MFDMAGFVRMVEVFEDMEINAEQRIQVRLPSPVEGSGCEQFDTQPGTRTLTANEALACSRIAETTKTLFDQPEASRDRVF
ncbi:MAG: hypothetical protein EA415_14430 [Sphaerobacteraceae bacterium]|nr:MAG: hypothetical protein EA415_14430 [Sphaerobacteraceae bacterium]